MTPFRPVSFAQVAADVPETPDWLVDRLIVKRSLGLMVGDPKAGKSELTYQMVVAVAQGRRFLGRPTVQGGVLIIVAEESRDDAVRRLKHFGLKVTDAVWLWTETVFDTAEDQKKIRDFIKERVALIIIDTLATYLLLDDETDNSKVSRRLKPYVDLAHETGVTALFIHHQRKNRDVDERDNNLQTVRGGTAITAAADAIYQLQKTPGGATTQRRLVITSRYRDLPRALMLDYPDWPDGEYVCQGTPQEQTSAARREKTLALLPTRGPGLTVQEVADRTGTKPGAARQALEDACNADPRMATRTGDGKRRDPYRYLRIVTPAHASDANDEPAEEAA